MTDATLSYAKAIRRLATVQAGIGGDVILTLNPPSAIYLADMLERGCRRSDYVRDVQKEAERLRDEAEDGLLKAQDLNDAADRALARAEWHLRRARWVAGMAVLGLVVVAGMLA